MWEASGGNALYLKHLVQGALESGALREVGGVWQMRGRAAVTSELASLLDGRVDHLDDAVLHVLKLLTLCEPIDLDVLADLGGDDAVEKAESEGLIRIAREGRALSVRYAHPLFGEVIRGRLGFASSRRLRGHLVEALGRREVASASDRIRLAGLALDSDADLDPGLLCEAARDALMLANVPMGSASPAPRWTAERACRPRACWRGRSCGRARPRSPIACCAPSTPRISTRSSSCSGARSGSGTCSGPSATSPLRTRCSRC